MVANFSSVIGNLISLSVTLRYHKSDKKEILASKLDELNDTALFIVCSHVAM